MNTSSELFAIGRFNHGLPVNDLTSSSVGTYTSPEGFAIPRTMPFSLQYSF
jgi:hypothetical protein